MEYFIMDHQGLSSLVGNLGYDCEDDHFIPDDCEDLLEEMVQNLSGDDINSLNTRKHLQLAQVIQKNLIPLLKKAAATDRVDIFWLAIKVSMMLTQPMECLKVYSQPHHQLAVASIKQMLAQVKDAFMKEELWRTMVGQMKLIVDGTGDYPMHDHHSQQMNDGLLLFRNILHIPNGGEKRSTPIMTNYLLKHGLGRIITYLLKQSNKEYWCQTVIQLLSVIYKDQGYSVLPVSKKRSVHDVENAWSAGFDDWGVQSEDSDLGSWDRNTEEMEIINDDSLEVQASGNDSGEAEDSANETNETEIRARLVHFMKSLLRNGFQDMILGLKKLMVRKAGLDVNYLMWFLGFTCQFAKNLPVMYTNYREVISGDMFSFMVYLGTKTWEEVLVAEKRKTDITAPLRRCSMVLVALRELLILEERLSQTDLSEEEAENLKLLKKYLTQLDGLALMFLLMLRLYKPDVHGLDFLREVIATNHQFLKLVEQEEEEEEEEDSVQFDILKHISRFGTKKIMSTYGLLLGEFRSNPSYLNESIFTIMHHVAGDCHNAQVLVQVDILQVFTEIWDCSYYTLPPECRDLIEFVIESFIRSSENMEDMVVADSSDTRMGGLKGDWTESELKMLLESYMENDSKKEVLRLVQSSLATQGFRKSKEAILAQLFAQQLLPEQNLQELITCNSLDVREIARLLSDGDLGELKQQEVVPFCVEKLTTTGKGEHLQWIQKLLLEVCYIKLGGRALNEHLHPEEPVPLHYILQGMSIPVIPYTEDQADVLSDQHFDAILQNLGFHLAEDVGQIFHRIPEFWTPNDCFEKVKQLGPVQKEWVKFTEDDLAKYTELSDPHHDEQDKPVEMSVGPSHSGHRRKSIPSELWLNFIHQCNVGSTSNG